MRGEKLAGLAIAVVALFAFPTFASDLAPLPTHKMAPTGPYCVDFNRVAFHSDADPARIRDIVQEHYAFSRKISEETRIVYNVSPTYFWADQTRVYCGMAIGYFEYDELNDEAVGKCECFYQQMIRYMQR